MLPGRRVFGIGLLFVISGTPWMARLNDIGGTCRVILRPTGSPNFPPSGQSQSAHGGNRVRRNRMSLSSWAASCRVSGLSLVVLPAVSRRERRQRIPEPGRARGAADMKESIPRIRRRWLNAARRKRTRRVSSMAPRLRNQAVPSCAQPRYTGRNQAPGSTRDRADKSVGDLGIGADGHKQEGQGRSRYQKGRSARVSAQSACCRLLLSVLTAFARRLPLFACHGPPRCRRTATRLPGSPMHDRSLSGIRPECP